jgi:hypothetical protein
MLPGARRRQEPCVDRAPGRYAASTDGAGKGDVTMTASIDQSLSWRTVAERLAHTDNPRHRQMLQTLADHLRAEEHLSLEKLMATLVPEPKYHLWKNGSDYGPKGAAAVRSYYSELVESKRGVLEYAIERIVVDDSNIVTEGTIRAFQRGAIARGFGFNVPDADETYLVPYRAVIFWPFNAAGEMLGEDGYSTFDPDSAERVALEDLPEAYLALFAAR